MFQYEGKDYKSKADVVRYLYDKGELTLSSSDKKRIAAKLEMTYQTVHATLVKHMNVKVIEKTVIKTEDIIENDLTPAIIKSQSNQGRTININSSRDIENISVKDPHRFKVTIAPNPWGLPITNPPLNVIDEKFTQYKLDNWSPKEDSKIVSLFNE